MTYDIRISMCLSTGRHRRGDFTDFTDVPEGTADKIIIFPTNEQTPLLSTLLPDELSLNISEGSLWMLMDPHANKQYTMELLCDRWNIDLNNVVAFGDDINRH